MFSGSGITTKLVRKLPDVWTNEELNMASVNRKKMYAIFDSSQIHTSSNLRSSLVSFPDPDNMGIALEFRCYLLYTVRNTILHMYFRLMTAMFDLPVTPISESIHTSLTM